MANTSTHSSITFSNSSNEMNMRRRVLSTLSIWLTRSLEMASTRRSALGMGYLVFLIFRRWVKMVWTDVLMRSSSVAASRSLMGKSFIRGL